jgi:hypothetical protein
MSINDRYDLQLKGVVNALSHSIRIASDDEVLEDAREIGIDVKATAARLKHLFSVTAKAYQKRNLLKAQQEYAQEVSAIGATSFDLPATATEKRQLLHLVAAQYAQTAGAAFTAKFRDLDTLSDADVESLLSDCAELGLLPKKPQE